MTFIVKQTVEFVFTKECTSTSSSDKMKNVLCVVFLAFISLVLSHQDVQKKFGFASRSSLQVTAQSTVNALTKLVKEGAPIKDPPEISVACLDDMAESKFVGDATTGILYDFQTTCYVAGDPFASQVLVLSKTQQNVPPGSRQCCALSQAFQAVFLPFRVDADTYMILDPSIVRWFFTSTLSGCDIFVARPGPTAPIPGNRPIVIHSNRNKCGNKLQNLEEKGKSVEQMMKKHPNYELIARVYSEPSPGEAKDANIYLEKFKLKYTYRGVSIKLISYRPDQAFYFIGHYVPEQWKFILKGRDDGTTTVFQP